VRDEFAVRLAEIAGQDPRVLFITGDLGFGVFEEYAQEHPNQYLNAGVAEQNMTAVAAGMALSGRIVFTYSIGNFPVLRCLEQIRNDAAYHDANVNVVSIGGGFSYGPLGMSHHATEDIAIMRALPQVTTLVPGTREDVAHSVDHLVATSGVGYLRLDKSAGKETAEAQSYAPGSWRLMRDGGDVALVATGGVLESAQGAAELLQETGISARVVNAVQLAPMSNEIVREVLAGVPLVLTVEEHVTRGGLGGLVAESLAGAAGSAVVERCGIDAGFLSAVVRRATCVRRWASMPRVLRTGQGVFWMVSPMWGSWI